MVLAVLNIFAKAHAEVTSVHGATNGAVFKADGKVVTAREATELAKTKQIERCTPIKGAADINGNAIGAVKCSSVVLQYDDTSKTGLPKWVKP